MLRRIISDGIIYGGADALSRLVAFCIFPLIARALSVNGFGVLELTMTMVTMGGLVVRCGMNNAVQRFYWDDLTPGDQRPTLVTTGLTIIFGLGVMLAVMAFTFQALVLPSEEGSGTPFSAIGVIGFALLVPLTPWIQYLQDVLRLHFARLKFVAFSFLTRSFSTILAAVAVVMFSGGVESVLFAQAIVLLVAFPLGLWLIRQDLTKQIDLLWGKRLIVFGSPYILTEAAFWVFSCIDRWMLASMIGADEVGVYSAASRISNVGSFLSLAFGMAWSPYAVKLKSEFPTQYKYIYAEMLVLLLVVMLLVGGGIAMFSGELLAMLLPVEFAGAATPLAILGLCVVVQASQQITAAGISLSSKPHLFVYLTWIAAGVNALLNLIFIPNLGATGAAWATLVSHLVLTAGYLLCTQRVFPIPFPVVRLLWLAAIGVALLWSALVLHSSEMTFSLTLFKLAILLGCITLGWSAVRMQVLLLPSEPPHKSQD
jgi:O-antigen/teichoic acid export membrane protein